MIPGELIASPELGRHIRDLKEITVVGLKNCDSIERSNNRIIRLLTEFSYLSEQVKEQVDSFVSEQTSLIEEQKSYIFAQQGLMHINTPIEQQVTILTPRFNHFKERLSNLNKNLYYFLQAQNLKIRNNELVPISPLKDPDTQQAI